MRKTTVAAFTGALAGMLLALLAACTPPGTGAVTGDSLVAGASDFDNHDPGIRLIGFAGYDPESLNMTGEASRVIASHPKTVVINWNGNNTENLRGDKFLTAYESSLRVEISYFQRHGVRRIVLASPLPSQLNDANHSVRLTSATSALPGQMLGHPAIGDLDRYLATQIPGVTYSEDAARKIYPDLVFDHTKTIDNLIHLTPANYKIYAVALRKLAGGND